MITVKMPLAHAVPVRDTKTGQAGIILQEHPVSPASPDNYIDLCVLWYDDQEGCWEDAPLVINDSVEVDLGLPQGFAHAIRWFMTNAPIALLHLLGGEPWDTAVDWVNGEITDVHRWRLKHAIEKVQRG